MPEVDWMAFTTVIQKKVISQFFQGVSHEISLMFKAENQEITLLLDLVLGVNARSHQRSLNCHCAAFVYYFKVRRSVLEVWFYN